MIQMKKRMLFYLVIEAVNTDAAIKKPFNDYL